MMFIQYPSPTHIRLVVPKVNIFDKLDIKLGRQLATCILPMVNANHIHLQLAAFEIDE